MWKKTANFRAGNWIWQGCNWIDFYNQNCNCGLDWTNHKLRTNVNSDTFLPPFPFNWNDAFCLKRRRFIHCSHKKRPNGAVLNGTVGLLLPLDAWSRGRRRFFFPLFSPTFFLLKASKRHRPRTPTCPKLSTCWRKGRRCAPWVVEGRQHNSRPGLSPPCFLPINTGETRRKKKGEEREQWRL